ncbi:hypothetical protein ACFFX0_20540 [Citricoccus parietis]|uniref:Uncharacterized protein n=1 Tax=Citricoccus parietis TaxID=592307 RepID=A0ABV5G3F5_9MICC
MSRRCSPGRPSPRCSRCTGAGPTSRPTSRNSARCSTLSPAATGAPCAWPIPA